MNLKEQASAYLWTKQEAKLILFLFLITLLFRGQALMHGYAIDDYILAKISASDVKEFFLNMSRPVAWLIYALIENVGANVIDAGFTFALSAFLAQAVFITYSIRFVGLRSLPAAFICGSIIILHPYLCEVYSYRCLLPSFTLILLLMTAAIETARSGGWRASTIIAVNIFLSISLAIYQVAFSYVFAVALCGIIANILARKKHVGGKWLCTLRPSLLLFTCLFTSGLLHVLILKLCRVARLIPIMETRSTLIHSEQISQRISEFMHTIRWQYFSHEPIMHTPLKVLTGMALIISLLLIVSRLYSLYGIALAVVLSGSLITLWSLASIGIILPLQEWHPVPRVLSHSSLLIGLTLLIAWNYSTPRAGRNYFRYVMYPICTLLFLSYGLAGTQAMADQLRVNQWDAMFANRILGRLEAMPDYNHISRIMIIGGSTGYERKLRTMQYGMNISAFSRDFAIGSLLSEATGKDLVTVRQHSITYAACKAPWPSPDSIVIREGTVLICLPSDRLP